MYNRDPTRRVQLYVHAAYCAVYTESTDVQSTKVVAEMRAIITMIQRDE
jgi:hypothetical protein